MKLRSNTFLRIFVGFMAFTQFVVGASFAGTAILFIWKFFWPVIARAREAGALEGPVIFVLIAGGLFSLLFLVAGLAVVWSSLMMFRKIIKNDPISIPHGIGKGTKDKISANIHSRSKNSLRFKISGDGSFIVSSRSLYKPVTIVVVVMALLWNGMLALNFMDKGSAHSLVFVIFQTPFLVIGLGLVALAGYLLLALRHPSIEIRLYPSENQRSGDCLNVRPEDHLSFFWRLKGDRGQLAHLKIWLESRTLKPDSTGFRPTSHTIMLAEKIDLRSSRQGQLSAAIPKLDTANEELFFACHASAPFAPDVWLVVPIPWEDDSTTPSPS